jgi:hypothetical protein
MYMCWTGSALIECLCFAAGLVGLKSVVDRVCAVNVEYANLGNAHFDTLLDAFADCMGVASALWLEISDLVHTKFMPGR